MSAAKKMRDMMRPLPDRVRAQDVVGLAQQNRHHREGYSPVPDLQADRIRDHDDRDEEEKEQEDVEDDDNDGVPRGFNGTGHLDQQVPPPPSSLTQAQQQYRRKGGRVERPNLLDPTSSSLPPPPLLPLDQTTTNTRRRRDQSPTRTISPLPLEEDNKRVHQGLEHISNPLPTRLLIKAFVAMVLIASLGHALFAYRQDIQQMIQSAVQAATSTPSLPAGPFGVLRDDNKSDLKHFVRLRNMCCEALRSDPSAVAIVGPMLGHNVSFICFYTTAASKQCRTMANPRYEALRGEQAQQVELSQQYLGPFCPQNITEQLYRYTEILVHGMNRDGNDDVSIRVQDAHRARVIALQIDYLRSKLNCRPTTTTALARHGQQRPEVSGSRRVRDEDEQDDDGEE